MDSLKIIIENPKLHDTVKLNTLALIIDNVYDPDSILTYSKKMYEIAQKNLNRKDLNKKQRNHYLLYLAAYYSNISFCYEQVRNPKSLSYLNKSIALYEKANATEEVYSSIVSKGILLSRRKQYKEAIDCYFKALRFFEKDENKHLDGISYVYSNLVSIYEEQSQNKITIKYLEKSLAYLNKRNTKPTLEDDLQKFIINYNIGSVYIHEKQYQLATTYLNDALILSKKHDHDSYSSMALGRLGLICMQTTWMKQRKNW